MYLMGALPADKYMRDPSPVVPETRKPYLERLSDIVQTSDNLGMSVLDVPTFKVAKALNEKGNRQIPIYLASDLSNLGLPGGSYGEDGIAVEDKVHRAAWQNMKRYDAMVFMLYMGTEAKLARVLAERNQIRIPDSVLEHLDSTTEGEMPDSELPPIHINFSERTIDVLVN